MRIMCTYQGENGPIRASTRNSTHHESHIQGYFETCIGMSSILAQNMAAKW